MIEVKINYEIPYSYGRTNWKVPSYDKLDEWMEDNISGEWRCTGSRINGSMAEITIEFQNKIDAGLFLLRWK